MSGLVPRRGRPKKAEEQNGAEMKRLPYQRAQRGIPQKVRQPKTQEEIRSELPPPPRRWVNLVPPLSSMSPALDFTSPPLFPMDWDEKIREMQIRFERRRKHPFPKENLPSLFSPEYSKYIFPFFKKAAITDNLDLLEALIQKSSNVDQKVISQSLAEALISAILFKHPKIIVRLLKEKNFPIDELFTNKEIRDKLSYILESAVKVNDLQIVDRLLSIRHPQIDLKVNNSLIVASQHGFPEIVQRLLEDERVDPTVTNNLPVRIATRYRNFRISSSLLY